MKFFEFENSLNPALTGVPRSPRRYRYWLLVCSVSLHPVSIYIIFRLLPDMNTLGEGASLLKFMNAHRTQIVRPLLVI